MNSLFYQKMTLKNYLVAALAGAAGLILVAVILVQEKTATSKKASALLDNREGGFAWRDGILVRGPGKIWNLQMLGEAHSKVVEEVRAFPWESIAQIDESPGIEGGIKRFPKYPREKYELDGHPYPVGQKASWFGAICRNESEFADYMAVMDSLNYQLGWDPRSVAPVFTGTGFYIVTSSY